MDILKKKAIFDFEVCLMICRKILFIQVLAILTGIILF
jgi:hypothetical protein